MSNDRELLEAAAKAAGIVVIRSRLGDPLAQDMLVANGQRNPHHETGPWNPLTDDGDALRLAVTLHMTVRCYMGTTVAQVGVPGQRNAYEEATDHADPYAATRRAIVRAAAAIGGLQ